MKTSPGLSVTARDAARWRTLRNKALTEALARAGLSDEPLGAPRPWYRINNAAGMGGEPALIHLYAEIGYWGITAADFIDELREISADAIELHINSHGGDVYDGIAIYSALIDHQASVAVHVDALAASAASFIAQA